MEVSLPAAPSSGDERGTVGELLRIALPLVLSSGSMGLQYVVDRMFLSWYANEAIGVMPHDALAASLPAGMLHWTLMSVVLGTAAYVTTFVAQYEGAGRKDRVVASLWQGIYFSLAASLFIMLFQPLGGPIFSAFGHDPAIERLEVEYFSVLCFGSAPFILAETLACFYTGRGKTMVVLWVNVAQTAVNIVLDYALIFGAWGFPEMGIRGAALATVIAALVKVCLFAGLLAMDETATSYGLRRHARFDPALFWRLLRFGFPNGLMFFSDVICFSLFFQFIGSAGGSEGKAAMAATNLAFTANTLAFLPMVGLGTAVMTLVGQRVGEGRPDLAVRTTWIAYGITSGYLFLFALAYVFTPGLILWPYSIYSAPAEFAELSRVVVLLLRFAAAFAMFDAMVVIFSAAVRGAGDTRFALLFTGTAGWLALVLPTYWVYRFRNADLLEAWGVVTVYIAIVGIGFLLRFLGGRWKSMRVIESEPPQELSVSSSEPVAGPIGDLPKLTPVS